MLKHAPTPSVALAFLFAVSLCQNLHAGTCSCWNARPGVLLRTAVTFETQIALTDLAPNKVQATLIVKCPEKASVTIGGSPTVASGQARQYCLVLDQGNYRVCLKTGEEKRSTLLTLCQCQNTYVVSWDDCTPEDEDAEATQNRSRQAAGASALQTGSDGSSSVVFEWTGTNRGNPKAQWKARIDEQGIMDVRHGAFMFDHKVDTTIREELRNASGFSIEAVFKAGEASQPSPGQAGPARIISYSTDINNRSFTLGQDGHDLVLRVRTSGDDRNGTDNQKRFTLKDHTPITAFNHVVIAYGPERVSCYVNGDLLESQQGFDIAFDEWTQQCLLVGDELGGQRNWNGYVARFAIHDRALTDFQVKRRFSQAIGQFDGLLTSDAVSSQTSSTSAKSESSGSDSGTSKELP